MQDLTKLVQNKIESLGVKEAATYFGVSIGTASNWSTGKTPPSLNAVQLVLDEQQPIITEVKQQEVTWEGRKVMILLPVYRSFNADTHFTLFANYAKYGPEKIGMEIIKRTVIHEARNILVNKALKTQAEDFLMFDDDMILPCGNSDIFNGRYGAGVDNARASVNAISRLMSHSSDKGIIGGLYFGRHKTGKSQCALGFESTNENKKLRALQYDGLVNTRWVATGAMRIPRWVLEKMKDAIDSGKFPECKPANESLWHGFFNPLRVGVGEDVSFCARAGEIGIKSYVDGGLVCLHVGDENYGPSNTNG